MKSYWCQALEFAGHYGLTVTLFSSYDGLWNVHLSQHFPVGKLAFCSLRFPLDTFCFNTAFMVLTQHKYSVDHKKQQNNKNRTKQNKTNKLFFIGGLGISLA